MINQHIKHIGLIPDGTRRWARKNDMSLRDAYFEMVNVIAQITDYFFTAGIDFVSIYLLSKDNLQRNPYELDAVYEAELYFLRELVPPITEKYGLDIVLVGDLSLLPTDIEKQFKKFKTPQTHSRKLYLLLAYNPFDEIIECISGKNQTNSEEALSSLWVPLPLDIVIRTGGEHRLSMFLPLQSSYAELFFLSDYINDIDMNQVLQILEEFNQRQRRFGR